MKKLLVLALLGLALGGCNRDDLDGFKDAPPGKSAYQLSFYIVHEDSSNLFPKSLYDTSYAGHPLDPGTFKAFNQLGETIHDLGFNMSNGLSFQMNDLFSNYGEEWGQNESDTIIHWRLCFGNKCDTMTLGVHTPAEAGALGLSQFPFGQKWIVWQGDTVFNIASQHAVYFKSWIQ